MDYTKEFPYLINEDSVKDYFYDKSIYKGALQGIVEAQLAHYNHYYKEVQKEYPDLKNPIAQTTVTVITTYQAGESPTVGIQLQVISIPNEVVDSADKKVMIPFIAGVLKSFHKVLTEQVTSGPIYDKLVASDFISNHRLVGFIYAEEVSSVRIPLEDFEAGNMTTEDLKKLVEDGKAVMESVLHYSICTVLEEGMKQFPISTDGTGLKSISSTPCANFKSEEIEVLPSSLSGLYEKTMSLLHSNLQVEERILQEEIF